MLFNIGNVNNVIPCVLVMLVYNCCTITGVQGNFRVVSRAVL